MNLITTLKSAPTRLKTHPKIYFRVSSDLCCDPPTISAEGACTQGADQEVASLMAEIEELAPPGTTPPVSAATSIAPSVVLSDTLIALSDATAARQTEDATPVTITSDAFGSLSAGVFPVHAKSLASAIGRGA